MRERFRARIAQLAERANAHPRPFTDEQIDGIAAMVEQPLPASLRALWQTWGAGSVGAACFYDPMLVEDLLDVYAECELEGLIPLASDGGSRDYALDLLGRHPTHHVMVSDRAVMSEEHLSPVAQDVGDLIEHLLADDLDSDPPSLGELRQEARMAEIYDHLEPPLAGLGRDDIVVRTIDFETGQPSEVEPRRPLTIAGVWCAADACVRLAQGQVVHATLVEDTEVLGRWLAADTFFTIQRGALSAYYPRDPVTIGEATFAAREYISDFYTSDGVRHVSGTLAFATRIEGVPCAAASASLCLLDGSWWVAKATLSEDYVIGGVALPEGSWFERFPGHEGLYALQTPTKGGRVG